MAGIFIENSDIIDKPSGSGDNPSIFAGLFVLPPAQFVLLSVLIGIMLSENLNPDEQNTLGNFIANIGQTLMTVAGQAQFRMKVAEDSTEVNTDDSNDTDEINVQLTEMKKRIAELESRLNEK